MKVLEYIEQNFDRWKFKFQNINGYIQRLYELILNSKTGKQKHLIIVSFKLTKVEKHNYYTIRKRRKMFKF